MFFSTHTSPPFFLPWFVSNVRRVYACTAVTVLRRGVWSFVVIHSDTYWDSRFPIWAPTVSPHSPLCVLFAPSTRPPQVHHYQCRVFAHEKHCFPLFSLLILAVSVGLSQTHLRYINKIIPVSHFQTMWNRCGSLAWWYFQSRLSSQIAILSESIILSWDQVWGGRY